MLTQNLGTSSYPVSPYRSNSIVIVTSSLPCCRCVCWWGFLLLVPIKNGWCSLLLIPFYSFVIFVLEISRLKAAFGTLDLSSLLDTCCWCTVLFHRVPRCRSLPSPCRWSFHQRKSRTGEKHICPCSPLRSFPSYAQQLWCSSATWYSHNQKDAVNYPRKTPWSRCAPCMICHTNPNLIPDTYICDLFMRCPVSITSCWCHNSFPPCYPSNNLFGP